MAEGNTTGTGLFRQAWQIAPQISEGFPVPDVGTFWAAMVVSFISITQTVQHIAKFIYF
jgi:hypothetical protein